MINEFKLPALGENIAGGTVAKISIGIGDAVKKDQTLLELETDKATIEVPSPSAGVIKEILVKVGAQAKVGQIVMKIDSEAATAAKAAPSPAPAKPVKEERPETGDRKPEIKDLPQPAQRTQQSTPQIQQPAKDVAAAPSVRRFAREIGVNIEEVPGSGPAGRIFIEDVKAYAKQRMSGMVDGGVATVSAQPLPDFARWGEIERKAMNNIRRKTAERLSHAWTTIPHVTQFDKADITDLEKLRKRYSTPEQKLTITPFLLKVIASALKTFPQFNASIDMRAQEIVYKKYFHIGVAVDTDRGLLVPVIRDIDKKSIFELTKELNEAAERARNKKTTIEEMQGSCFTLTNLGGIGGTYFTPIVNWPDVAILGVSRAEQDAVFTGSMFVPRLMLPLSLSYDHRVIDGADGARFLRWIAEAIQQPFLMELSS